MANYARVARLSSIRDLDAASRLTREKALPAWRQMKGYRLGAIHQVRDANDLLVVTFWETPEDERASNVAISPIRDEVIAAASPSATRVDSYEVAFMLRKVQPQPGSFARMTETEAIRPENINRTIDDYKQQIVPELQKRSGFQVAALLVDRGANRAISTSIWSDENALRESGAALASLRDQFIQTHEGRLAGITETRLLAVDVPAGVTL